MAEDFPSKATSTASCALARAAATDGTGAAIGPATVPAITGLAVAVAAVPNDTGAKEMLGSKRNVPPGPMLSDVPAGRPRRL